MAKQPAVETCGNCGRVIGKLETATVWKENIVCAACHRILEDAGVGPAAMPKAKTGWGRWAEIAAAAGAGAGIAVAGLLVGVFIFPRGPHAAVPKPGRAIAGAPADGSPVGVESAAARKTAEERATARRLLAARVRDAASYAVTAAACDEKLDGSYSGTVAAWSIQAIDDGIQVAVDVAETASRRAARRALSARAKAILGEQLDDEIQTLKGRRRLLADQAFFSAKQAAWQHHFTVENLQWQLGWEKTHGGAAPGRLEVEKHKLAEYQAAYAHRKDLVVVPGFNETPASKKFSKGQMAYWLAGKAAVGEAQKLFGY